MLFRSVNPNSELSLSKPETNIAQASIIDPMRIKLALTIVKIVKFLSLILLRNRSATIAIIITTATIIQINPIKSIGEKFIRVFPNIMLNNDKSFCPSSKYAGRNVNDKVNIANNNATLS